MKIIKEVIIAASIDDIWSWLNDNIMIIGNPGHDMGEIKSSSILTGEKNSHLKIIVSNPPKKLVISSDKSSTLMTSFDLLEKGKRIGLKVTISGWEGADSDRVRHEMPQVSLDWEKKLGLVKKAIESGRKCLQAK
jgi:hypothetical protein